MILLQWAVVGLTFAAVNMRWLRLAADGPATPQARERLVVGVPAAPPEPGTRDVRITEGENADARRGDG